jgi:hypothetical protein
MKTNIYAEIRDLSAEAADHRESALDLAASIRDIQDPLDATVVAAKAQVFATLSLSCEQRVANLVAGRPADMTAGPLVGEANGLHGVVA